MQRRSLDSSGAETPSDTQRGLPLTEVLAPQCWHSLIDEKKDIHSGSEECGKIFYTTETVVFSPRLRKAKENERSGWTFTFSHWVVDVYKNATSRQALTILCWLIQNIMKNHFKLGHKDLLAQPVLYIPQKSQPLAFHASGKRSSKWLGRTEALLTHDFIVQFNFNIRTCS